MGRRKYKLSSFKKGRMAVWIVHFKKKKVTGRKDQSEPQARHHGVLDPCCSLSRAKRGDLRTATRQIQKELVNNSCRRREEAIQVASGILVG